MPYVSKKKALELNIPRKTLQTIEMPMDKFNITTAKTWLKKHNYANSYYRKTTNYIRFMQVMPITGANFHSKKLPSGIIFVYQSY